MTEPRSGAPAGAEGASAGGALARERPASRIARVSGQLLRVAGAVVLTSGLLMAVAERNLGDARKVLGWLLLVFFPVGFLAALVRLAAFLFAESRYRLDELLATIAASGLATLALSRATLPQTGDPGQKALRFGFIEAGVLLLLLLGSAWGSRMAERTPEGRRWRRLCMVAGWMLVAGIVDGFLLALFLLSFWMDGRAGPELAICGAALPLLILPGVWLGRRSARAAPPDGHIP
ncbi:MAG: hypothetical protein HY873_01185 [Chloroflexi bacterium]|nr:hypothetical protein [Chloroflexota bacterium]